MYCELQFVGHSTRIGAHLAGTSGAGVAACSAVPEDVKKKMIRVIRDKNRERALQAKKRKIADNIRSAKCAAAASSNAQQKRGCIGTRSWRFRDPCKLK
jgi:hypothetical protein